LDTTGLKSSLNPFADICVNLLRKSRKTLKILILTPSFAPLIHPRAHRWTAITRHWASLGHEVHVVCARLPGEKDEQHKGNLHIHRTGYASLHELLFGWLGKTREKGRVGQLPGKPGKTMIWATKAYHFLWQNLYFPDDAVLWQRSAFQKAVELLEKNSFDRLITVSLPFSSHMVGWKLKRHFPTIHWLADIGDPFSLQAKPLNNWRLRSLKWEKKVLETADATVVTTPATRELYASEFGDKAVEKMRVVPPLLDPPWNEKSTPSVLDGVLRLGYFGAFYAGVREPHLLFGLYDDLLIQGRDFELHWYGNVPAEAWKKIETRPFFKVHGFQSRETAREAMTRMDVLINVGNSTTWQLPSKVVEYYASGKPVLHLAVVKSDAFEQFFEGTGRLISDLSEKVFAKEADTYTERFEVEAISRVYLD